MRFTPQILLALALCALPLAACTAPTAPDGETVSPPHDGSLRIAALDYQIGDLDDPAVMAKYTRADILIAQPDQFWGRSGFEGRMALLRAANPNLKIIGYFRSKVVRKGWGDHPRSDQAYNYDLYQASLPYWSRTTTGDTVSDWPGVAVFDFTDPAARQAMIRVFASYQNASSNKFDGVFWDYFNPSLWVAPSVHDMDGEPDLDGDGIPHWEDADELAAFVAGQDGWVRDMQAAMGARFIQIANGSRALQDSTFAHQLDGMFYEVFPDVGFAGGSGFAKALDPIRYNNLWAAHSWPRTTNGGPWLILSHAPQVPAIRQTDGAYQPVDPGDLTRIVALLTDATAIHYDGSGLHRAGVPSVEFHLGAPLGGVTISGPTFAREFQNGTVTVNMASGDYPLPFAYTVVENGEVAAEAGNIH